MTTSEPRSNADAISRTASISTRDPLTGLRHQLARRARWVVACCVAGLATPGISGLLSASGGTIPWLVDLASHWQWLYAAMLIPACVILMLDRARWGLVLLAIPLPLVTASESAPAAAREAGMATLSVASVNVHLDNRDVAPLVRWLAEASPDVVVLHEVSPEYARQLETYGGYLYRQLAPANDPFGIAILSRLPLTGAKINTDMDGIRHMSALLNWNGQPVTLITWHPMPPLSPRYHQSRNTRLRAIAEAVRRDSHPAVLAGDLNATPWSNAFHGIDQMGLRRVTGLLPTWPAAGLGWMGIPIDHILVSAQWRVVEVSRGPDLGSDHLPVVARIALARNESRASTTSELDHSVLERPLKRLQGA